MDDRRCRGRPRPPRDATLPTSPSASPPLRTSPTARRKGWPTDASSAAGSAAWSATTSPTSSPATGLTTRSIPQALTDYIKGRQGYDYNEHGQAGNTHTAFVPDEIVDRFCIVGPPEVHIERMQQLKALGVDQFSIYLQHDDKDHTLQRVRREGHAGGGRAREGQRMSR